MHLGRMNYQDAWQIQKDAVAARQNDEIPDTLLLLEHPPTITFGKSAKREHLIATETELSALGVQIVQSDRGGDVTLHLPGQLVGYPIVHLQQAPNSPDLHGYMRRLEESLIRTIAKLGITADRFIGHTGVWLGMDTPTPVKVAAMGVRVSRYVTMHGFALNVCPDLSLFDLIVPCGIHEYGVTSLSAFTGDRYTVAELVPDVVHFFAEVSGYSHVNEHYETVSHPR